MKGKLRQPHRDGKSERREKKGEREKNKKSGTTAEQHGEEGEEGCVAALTTGMHQENHQTSFEFFRLLEQCMGGLVMPHSYGKLGTVACSCWDFMGRYKN